MYFRKQTNNPVTTNLDIPGYAFEHTPTESSAGGTLKYISNGISYVPQNDLQIYSPKELESIFIEILIPSNPAQYLAPSINAYQ